MARRPIRSLLLVLLLAGSVLISACGGKEPTPTPTATASPTPSPTATTSPTPTSAATPTYTPTPVPTTEPTGTLEVRVTDLPSRTITAIDITAEDIQVHRSADGQWVTAVEGPVSFDLVAVAGVEAVLGNQPLTPGDYTQVRLRVTSATIIEDGEEFEATVPSDTLKVVRPFAIRVGETTIATLDFDAERSVVSQGTGRFQLRPVVTLLVRKRGEPFQPAARPTATPTLAATATPTPTPTPEPIGEFFMYIEEPETAESIVAESFFTVVGRTRIDAVVSVNDIFAEVDSDGRFRVPMQLEEGPNIIEVIASLESGEELVEILVVIYSP